MKPHPRIRKSIKRGGAVVTVLLVVVWAVSGWWSIVWIGASGVLVQVYAGRLNFGWMRTMVPGASPGLRCSNQPRSLFDWWFDWGRVFNAGGRTVNNWGFCLPLWVPLIALLMVTLLAWRLDALAHWRARPHLCRKCHYDRTGLRGGVQAACPECGASPDSCSSIT